MSKQELTTIIMDTDDHYRGYHEGEECYVVSSYSELCDDPLVDDNTIDYAPDSWVDEKTYFSEFLKKCQNHYRRETGKKATKIVLCGSVGTWQGDFTGGKVVEKDGHPFDASYDRLYVTLDVYGDVTVCFSHHDGTHRMGLFLFTATELNELTREVEKEYEIFDRILKDGLGMKVNAHMAPGYFKVPDPPKEMADEVLGAFW